MRQLTLGFVQEEPKAVALDPKVEKSVVTLMARMIAGVSDGTTVLVCLLIRRITDGETITEAKAPRHRNGIIPIGAEGKKSE
jgi:hypothetical protein